jgi:hypothetical protein
MRLTQITGLMYHSKTVGDHQDDGDIAARCRSLKTIHAIR